MKPTETFDISEPEDRVDLVERPQPQSISGSLKKQPNRIIQTLVSRKRNVNEKSSNIVHAAFDMDGASYITWFYCKTEVPLCNVNAHGVKNFTAHTDSHDHNMNMAKYFNDYDDLEKALNAKVLKTGPISHIYCNPCNKPFKSNQTAKKLQSRITVHADSKDHKS